jgi:hypothetical protein
VPVWRVEQGSIPSCVRPRSSPPDLLNPSRLNIESLSKIGSYVSNSQSCSTVTDENSRFYINRGETVVKAVNSLGNELCLDYGSDTRDGQEAYFNDW